MFNRLRGENKNHSFTTVDEAKNQASIPPISNEIKYMSKIKKPYIEDLSKKGVINIPDFCQSMKVYGMNYKQISEFLKLLLCYLKISISNRFISKSNSSEKNLIFTWIYIKYSIDIIGFLYKFISEKNQSKNNIDLRNEINSKIKQIQKQDDNTLSNKQNEKQEIKQESSEEQPQNNSSLIIEETTNTNFFDEMDNDNINEYDELDNQDLYFDYNYNNDQFHDYY